MNQLYIHSIIKIREWDKTNSIEYNRADRNIKDSAKSQNESIGQDKLVLSLWFLKIAKRFKGIFALKTEDSLKV